MNDVGDLLAPTVVVLLIGERPGLATAVSLFAYMAFRPRTGHTDADRNLVSNIHARSVGLDDAASVDRRAGGSVPGNRAQRGRGDRSVTARSSVDPRVHVNPARAHFPASSTCRLISAIFRTVNQPRS